jgi:hypothetical protein
VPNLIVLPLLATPGEFLPLAGLGERDRLPGLPPSRLPPPPDGGGRPSGLGAPVGRGGNRQEAYTSANLLAVAAFTPCGIWLGGWWDSVQVAMHFPKAWYLIHSGFLLLCEWCLVSGHPDRFFLSTGSRPLKMSL